MVLAQDRSGVGARRHSPNLHLGMPEQQPEQLSACIASGARYGSPHSHSHEYAIVNNFMHFASQGLAHDCRISQTRLVFYAHGTGEHYDSG
jgi:hypothetical protein